MPIATLVPVTFRLPGRLVPTARGASVIGSFNGWNPSVHRMRLTAEGDWTVTVYLTPGRAVYCFSVDGVMWLDPTDEGRVPNGWGSEYSVRHVAADAMAAQLA